MVCSVIVELGKSYTLFSDKTPDPKEETSCHIYRHGMKTHHKFMVIFPGSAVNQIRNS
jgi:hypothetical protein